MKVSASAKELELWEGTVLKGNSHGVVIPSYGNHQVQQMHEEFRQNYGEEPRDHETARNVVRFTNQKFDYEDPTDSFNYDPRTGEKINDLPLELAIRSEKGRCKEKAAAGQMLMQIEGVNSRYVKASWDNTNPDSDRLRDRHALLKVETEEGLYHADPTLNEYQPYEQFLLERDGLNLRQIEQELLVEEGRENALNSLKL